jgi:hypothetical protein
MILFARSNIFTCSNYEMVVTNTDRFFGGLALGLSLCSVQHRKSFLDLVHGSNARGTTVNPNPVCSSHKWNSLVTRSAGYYCLENLGELQPEAED